MRHTPSLLAVLGLAAPGLAQSPPEWRLVPVATIGGAEASDDRQLFDLVPLHGVIGRGNGHVLLLDVRGTRVLEYDENGRYVRTIGRAGEGPGEFRFPYALALGRGDSLWVSDVLRYSVFPAASGSARGATLTARTFGQLRVGPQGMIQPLSAAPAPTGTGSLIPDHALLVRFDARGAVADTVWSGPAPRRVPVTVQVGRSSFSTHAVEQFGTVTHWDLLPDGTLVVADTTAYLIRLVAPDGTVTRTIGPGTAARRVTQADRDRATARIRNEQRMQRERQTDTRFRNPPELWQKQLEATPFGTTVQWVSGIRVDSRGRIWVGVSGPQSALERIDIYSPQGQLLGRVRQPPGMPATLYGNGLLAFVERDDSDAQRLVIMRVVE